MMLWVLILIVILPPTIILILGIMQFWERNKDARPNRPDQD